MSTQKRQPAGVPVGGEFASNEHDEAAGDLDRAPISDAEMKSAVDSLTERMLEEQREDLETRMFDENGIDPMVMAGNQYDPPEYLEVDWEIAPESSDYIHGKITAFREQNADLIERLNATGYPFADDNVTGADTTVRDFAALLDDEGDDTRKVFDERVPDDIVEELDEAADGHRFSMTLEPELGKSQGRWSVSARATLGGEQ